MLIKDLVSIDLQCASNCDQLLVFDKWKEFLPRLVIKENSADELKVDLVERVILGGAVTLLCYFFSSQDTEVVMGHLLYISHGAPLKETTTVQYYILPNRVSKNKSMGTADHTHPFVELSRARTPPRL